MSKSARFGIMFLGLFSLFCSAAVAQQTNQTTIERIDIRGNRRIPEETCRFYIQSRPGERYDERRLELDLKALHKSNYFESVEIQGRDGDIGQIVTFILKEKPLVRAIEYVGNKSFNESAILEEFKEKKIGLTLDSQYDPAKVRTAERSLKNLMVQNGKPLGTVYHEVEPVPPSSVRIRFVMDEGPTVRIGKIRFVGNRVFSDGELKSALKLDKERNVYTVFKGTDKYHKEKLEADIEMNLKAFYKERGYLRVQVGQPVTRIFEGSRGVLPVLRKTRQQFYIEIPIDAGDQYRVNKFELKECGIFKCEALLKTFDQNKGDVVNFKRIQDNLEQIKKLYGNWGYINFSYVAEQNLNPKDKTMDVVFTFEPDKQFFVKRINFLGNTKTRDKVMRREFSLEEGMPFSSERLETSVLRLNQLGFFDKIEEKDYEVKPDEKTALVDVDVKVKEKSHQSIGFTGGVSGISGSFIGINYTTNNFLGRGSSLEFSVSGGTRSTDFRVSYTEPYFLDSPWSLGLSVYNQRFRYDTYSTFGMTDNQTGEPVQLFTQKTTGSTVSMNRRLGRSFWSVGGSYSYQKIGISDIESGFENFALSQLTGLAPDNDTSKALSGIIRSEVSPMVSYNSTNDYFNPSRGSSFNFSTAISGLGGDFKMIRPALEFRHFIADKWLSGGRNVFAFNVQAQYIQSYSGSTIPFFERFYIGGENTIRGFDIRSISPIAVTSTPQFDSRGNPIIDPKTGLPAVTYSQPFTVGGDTYGVFNFEYRIPIVGPLSVAAFYDLGMVRVSRKSSLGTFNTTRVDIVGASNDKLRSSTGAEVQFILPVVSAPFRLIFAFNPQRINNSFTVGTQNYVMKEPGRDIKFTIGRSF